MDKIEAFRRVYEPFRAHLVRAHITIVFGVGSIEANDLRDLVVSVAATAQPFCCSLEHLKTWRDPASDERKLFLMVEMGRENLISLHQRLYEGLDYSKPRSDVPFDPHMTVATVSSESQLQAAEASASRLTLPVFGQVEALEIVSLQRDSVSFVDHISLGGHRIR